MDVDVRAFLVAAAIEECLWTPGWSPLAAHIEAGLAQVGASWADVRDVVITHHHPDHVGGLDQVRRQAPQATVWSGVDCPPARLARATGSGRCAC